MTAQTAQRQPRTGRNLHAGLATRPEQIEAAQRLRYQVFPRNTAVTWVRKHRELTQITLMLPATTYWDPEFRCADLLVLLEVKQLAGRYSRHFLK